MAKRTENDKCEVYFAADIQEKLGIGKTKTYEFLEDVYMQKSPFTVFKIGKLYAYIDNDYICCQKNGESSSMSAINIALNKACKKSGVRQVSVHSFRHIYATVLLERGVPLAKISALLGHSSIHTTFE